MKNLKTFRFLLPVLLFAYGVTAQVDPAVIDARNYPPFNENREVFHNDVQHYMDSLSLHSYIVTPSGVFHVDTLHTLVEKYVAGTIGSGGDGSGSAGAGINDTAFSDTTTRSSNFIALNTVHPDTPNFTPNLLTRIDTNQTYPLLMRNGEIIMRELVSNWFASQSQFTVAEGIGIGVGALQYTQGSYSYAFGENALQYAGGPFGIGIGTYAGQFNEGFRSLALGHFALRYVHDGGRDLTAIGYNAGSGTPGAPLNFENSTALGANSKITKSNQVTLGDHNTTEVHTTGHIRQGLKNAAVLKTDANGQIVEAVDGVDFPGFSYIDSADISQSSILVSANRFLQNADAGKKLRNEGATDLTLFIPAGLTFPEHSQLITFYCSGSGNFVIDGNAVVMIDLKGDTVGTVTVRLTLLERLAENYYLVYSLPAPEGTGGIANNNPDSLADQDADYYLNYLNFFNTPDPPELSLNDNQLSITPGNSVNLPDGAGIDDAEQSDSTTYSSQKIRELDISQEAVLLTADRNLTNADAGKKLRNEGNDTVTVTIPSGLTIPLHTQIVTFYAMDSGYIRLDAQAVSLKDITGKPVSLVNAHLTQLERVATDSYIIYTKDGAAIEEIDPTVPAHVKSITSNDISDWNDAHAHITNVSNPHDVDAVDVGLDAVENISPANMPVSNAQQSALNLKQDILHPGAGIVFSNDSVKVSGITFSMLAQNGAAVLQVPQWDGDSWEPATINTGAIDDGTTSLSTTWSSDKINTAIGAAGGGDMLSATYDPQDITGDAFSLSTHTGNLAWTRIDGKPVFSTVATTGSYNDLLFKPVLFSGSYLDLSDRPTALSAFSNDMNFIISPDDADADPSNEFQSLSYNPATRLVSLTNSPGFTLPVDDDNQTAAQVDLTPTGLFSSTNMQAFALESSDLIEALQLEADNHFTNNDISLSAPAFANIDKNVGDDFPGTWEALTGNKPVALSDLTIDISFNDADADPTNELQNALGVDLTPTGIWLSDNIQEWALEVSQKVQAVEDEAEDHFTSNDITGNEPGLASFDKNVNNDVEIGDFGIGGNAIDPPSDNPNNITASGLYRTGTTTLNLPVGSSSDYGHIVHIEAGLFGMASQTFTNDLGELFVRGKSTGVWGAWEQYLSSFTEEDPLFAASPAAGIVSGDIDTWNALPNKIIGGLAVTGTTTKTITISTNDGDHTAQFTDNNTVYNDAAVTGDIAALQADVTNLGFTLREITTNTVMSSAYVYSRVRNSTASVLEFTIPNVNGFMAIGDQIKIEAIGGDILVRTEANIELNGVLTQDITVTGPYKSMTLEKIGADKYILID